MAFDDISERLSVSAFPTLGMAVNYDLQRHRFESLANDGAHEMRADVRRYIGNPSDFGGCNPVNGHIIALTMPMIKPERVKLAAYVYEYGFFHDDILEGTNEGVSDADAFGLGIADQDIRARLGRKQIQAKMMYQLESTDKACAKHLQDVWSNMLVTTIQHKSRDFETLEEYIDFRIRDCGALFGEGVMLFGMGLVLNKQEREDVASTIYPCYAALGLTNDYFSFDREWEESQRTGESKFSNAVRLIMDWQSIDATAARELVRQAIVKYEKEFLGLREKFLVANPYAESLHRFLQAMVYQISGHVVWSLNCPRYHPNARYDPNSGIENKLLAERLEKSGSKSKPAVAVDEIDDKCSWDSLASKTSRASSQDDSACLSNSRRDSTQSSEAPEEMPETLNINSENQLDPKYVMAPFEYTQSLPSKGLRDMFIEALNLWAGLPETTVKNIKDIIDQLHTASLMLDDIEDGSELRRGFPATHTVFGVAQTINAATLAMINAIDKIRGLGIPGALDAAFEQLHDLHVGQSYDLYWTRHTICPSEAEYQDMVSLKTGGLFKLLSRLVCPNLDASLRKKVDEFVTLIGIYFQIMDDYRNLNSEEYTRNKGECEDLDEGKLSFLLVHYWNMRPSKIQVREILRQGRDQGKLSASQKEIVLNEFKRSGVMALTKEKLQAYEIKLGKLLDDLELSTGQENWTLRLLLLKLSIASCR